MELTKKELAHCGARVVLHWPAIIDGAGGVSIGDDVAIAPYFHVWGTGGVQIGDRVLIASHVAITSITHDHRAHRIHGTYIAKKVVIEDDCWIGAHSVILPGVRVGHGAVVGSGAIVTRDVPPRAIVVGAPARILKMRE